MSYTVVLHQGSSFVGSAPEAIEVIADTANVHEDGTASFLVADAIDGRYKEVARFAHGAWLYYRQKGTPR